MKLRLLLLCIVLTGCVPHEYGPPIDIYVSPTDDLDLFFKNFISDTEHTLECALYGFDSSYDSILDDVSKRATVRIVGDQKKELEWYEQRDKRMMHMKFCVRDSSNVWFGSFNPTPKKSKLNNIIRINSTSLAKVFEKEFLELYEQKKDKKNRRNKLYYNDKLMLVYFCPEDDCEDKLIDTLDRAQNTISFYLFSVTLPSLIPLLKEKQKQGVRVGGILEDRRCNMKFELCSNLKAIGNVSLDAKETLFHHKVFIIDNGVVITGSMNPTRNGVRGNDEVLVIIESKEVAKELEEKIRFPIR